MITGRPDDAEPLALALWAKNEKERAVNTLAGSLAMAEPEGYVRAFVDEGASMNVLLSAALEARQRSHHDAASRVSIRYLGNLLAAFAQEAATPAADEQLPEPLSERELEMLALIAAGKSNKEVARELFLSMSTITCSLRVSSHAFTADSRGFRNCLRKPCLPVLYFWMFPSFRLGYCQ